MAQNTELFHELMEVELARSVIAETGKRASDAASRRPPKMGCDNYSFSRAWVSIELV